MSNPCVIWNRDYILFDYLHFIMSSLNVFHPALKNTLKNLCIFLFNCISLFLFWRSEFSEDLPVKANYTIYEFPPTTCALYQCPWEHILFFSASPATILSMMSCLCPRCPWLSVDSHSNFLISTLVVSYPPVVLSSYCSQTDFASVP